MKALLLLSLTVALLAGPLALANGPQLKSMDCQITGYFGLPTATAQLRHGAIQMNVGLIQGKLEILEVSNSSIVAMTHDHAWEYSFELKGDLQPGRASYEGTLYKEYLIGRASGRARIGGLVCEIEI